MLSCELELWVAEKHVVDACGLETHEPPFTELSEQVDKLWGVDIRSSARVIGWPILMDVEVARDEHCGFVVQAVEPRKQPVEVVPVLRHVTVLAVVQIESENEKMKKASNTSTTVPHALTAAQLDRTAGGFYDGLTEEEWMDYHFPDDLGLPPNLVVETPAKAVAGDNGMGYGGSADDANTFNMPPEPAPFFPPGFRW